MTREMLQAMLDDFSDNSPLNFVMIKDEAGDTRQAAESAAGGSYDRNDLKPRGITGDMLGADEDSGLVGMRFYRHPVFSVGRAGDPGFEDIKRPEAVGAHHLMPEDWLPGAKSVISVFLPFEYATVDANKKDPVEPALEWVYTRVDGQRFLLAVGEAIRDALISEGYRAVTPYTEEKYVMRTSRDIEPGTEHIPPFSTNWSERHVGYVTGLGTFGMSTNFISRVGCTGRLVSVVTDWDVEPDVKDYDDWLGYCDRCGACIRKCGAKAHYSDRHGKDHEKCVEFIRKACERLMPRYGCGKCQSGLPCDYKPMKPKK